MSYLSPSGSLKTYGLRTNIFSSAKENQNLYIFKSWKLCLLNGYLQLAIQSNEAPPIFLDVNELLPAVSLRYLPSLPFHVPACQLLLCSGEYFLQVVWALPQLFKQLKPHGSRREACLFVQSPFVCTYDCESLSWQRKPGVKWCEAVERASLWLV